MDYLNDRFIILMKYLLIGTRIREEREKLSLSQEALGAVGGVKKQAQFNYEKGERMPTADYLAAIAQIGVDVQYILTGKPMIRLSSEEIVLVERWRRADFLAKHEALQRLDESKSEKSETSNQVIQSFDAPVNNVVGMKIINHDKSK